MAVDHSHAAVLVLHNLLPSNWTLKITRTPPC